MLISQHNALRGNDKTLTGMIGTIDQKCNILEVCEDAFNAASVLCDREYLDHPRLKATAIDTTDGNEATQDKVSAAYVPAHLHHIMFEILKVKQMNMISAEKTIVHEINCCVFRML